MLDPLSEVVKRREPDAVDRAVAILAEVDLVEVGLQDLVLVVVQLQQKRHHELDRLALQRALGRQEEILDELLRHRAAALEALSADEADERARDPARIDAVVGVEVAVFRREERLHQVIRHLAQAHQNPILVARGIDAADRQGLEAHERQDPALRVAHRGHHAVIERHADHLRGARPVPEHELPQRDLELVVPAGEPARLALAPALAITGAPQLIDDACR